MIERLLPAGPTRRIRVRISSRTDGDFHVDAEPTSLASRRQALAAGEWTWLRQVHGAHVVLVESAGDGAGTEADASVTSALGAVLAVQTADCAPVVLVADGAIGVAHAGWRGLVGGVIPVAVDAVRTAGRGRVTALLGPVIHPSSYEFGESDLAQVAAAVGASVRGETATGAPALDMPAAVAAALASAGVDDVVDLGIDTAGPEWFSHRVRGDVGRQVTTATLEAVE
ncbi:MAG: polyphenol oxidase family protein [Acidimicrobiales bacterium]|nr:polyphenol oxidase family protein [Acidimicrobiales bacterium]